MDTFVTFVKEMPNTSSNWFVLLPAIFGFIGIIIGAFINYYLGQRAKSKELEKMFEIQKINQAAKIAELLALKIEIDHEPDEHRKFLNQFSFEMSLYLPTDIYIDLAAVLQGKEGNNAKNWQDILIIIRKFYNGKDDKLNPNDIAFFDYNKG